MWCITTVPLNMPKFCCLIIRVFKRLFIINLTFIKQLMFENLFIHLLKKQSVDVMLGSDTRFCHQGSKSRPRAPAAYQCSESSVIPRSYQGAPKDSHVKEAHTNKQGIFYHESIWGKIRSLAFPRIAKKPDIGDHYIRLALFDKKQLPIV